MDEGPGEEDDATVAEDGSEHQDVVGVDAAAVRIVQREDIALLHRIERALFEQRRQRAAEARPVHEARRGGLRDELARCVENRRARVGTLLDEGAVRGPHDDDARLLGRHQQAAADDLACDGVVDGRGVRHASDLLLRAGPPAAKPT